MQCHLPSDGVTYYQYFCSSTHCCGGQKRKRPKPLPVPMTWLTLCLPQHFPGGFSGLERSSTEMVLKLERSAAESPLLMLPHPPATLVALWYHLTLPAHQQSVPISSSSLLMEVAELRLNLYVRAVSFPSSCPLVDEVPFPKALSSCCSLERVQVLIYNKRESQYFFCPRKVIKENTFSYSFL